MTNHISDMNIFQHRSPLSNTLKGLKQGGITIGFIGGSITDATKRFNWPEPVVAWLSKRYPDVRIHVENAAIGATGSDLAVFRAERDLLARGCDLIFVEYAVNDFYVAADQRMRTREGLLRKLLMDGHSDVVIVYTYNQDMYSDMMEEKTPDSIREFEMLADHYRLGSVWMGLNALNKVKAGELKWDEWLPDGLHPGSVGSLHYGEAVIQFLEKELDHQVHQVQNTIMDTAEETLDECILPKPMHPQHWQHAKILPWDRIRFGTPWTLRRWPFSSWMDQVLFTSAVGAKLSLSFNGTGICLGLDFGKYAASFRYRIDGGDWQLSNLERPDWCADRGWFVVSHLSAELSSAESHQLELEVVHGNGPNCKGTDFCLAFVGILDVDD